MAPTGNLLRLLEAARGDPLTQASGVYAGSLSPVARSMFLLIRIGPNESSVFGEHCSNQEHSSTAPPCATSARSRAGELRFICLSFLAEPRRAT
jgi:hypothetical protein